MSNSARSRWHGNFSAHWRAYNVRGKRFFAGKYLHLHVFPGAVLVLTVLGGFRYAIGTDYLSYEKIFDDYVMHGTTNGHFIEPLYCFCMSLVSFLGLRFSAFIFVIQALINGITFWAIWRMKKETGLWFPWAIFSFRYYLLGYNMVRQAIALAFVLLALTYFSKSISKFLLCTVVAMGFHLTAFIALPLAVCRVFYGGKRQTACYALILGGGTAMILGRTVLIRFLEALFPAIGYAAYLAAAQGGGSFAGYLFVVMPPLGAVVFAVHKIRKDSVFFFLLFAYFLGDVLLLTTLFSSNQLARIALYFTEAQIFILPYACRRLSEKYNRRIMVPYTFCVTVFMFAWDYLLLNNGQVMPYQSIFGA